MSQTKPALLSAIETEEALSLLWQLYGRATPGEWSQSTWGIFSPLGFQLAELRFTDDARPEHGSDMANAMFIVKAHNLFPQFKATLDAANARAEQERERAVKAEHLYECCRHECHELGERVRTAESNADKRIEEAGSIVDRVDQALLKALDERDRRIAHLEALQPHLVEVAAEKQRKACITAHYENGVMAMRFAPSPALAEVLAEAEGRMTADAT